MSPGRLPQEVTRAAALGVMLCSTALGIAGCGGSPAVAGPATANLLQLSQIPVPDFARIQGPSPVLLPGPKNSPLNRALSSGASVRYFRSVGFSFSNGYIDLGDSVWLLDSDSAAATAFHALVAQANESNTTVLSTGPIGTLSWAGARTAPAPDGLSAVQFTVIWETNNCVNELIARGRDGGVTLQQVLPLAKVVGATEARHTRG